MMSPIMRKKQRQRSHQPRKDSSRRKGRPGRRERVESRVESQKSGDARIVVGELTLHRDGYGFVVPSDGKGTDVFIPARYVGDAMHTDLVEARVVSEDRGRREGRITQIREHRVRRVMGRLERNAGIYQVVVDDRRVRHRVTVASSKLGGARPHDNVIVQIVQYPEAGSPLQGEIVEVLGKRGDEATEKSAVITRHQLTRGFSAAVLREAEAAAKRSDDADLGDRRDLLEIPFVTIDGETAQDFDDAVAVERVDDHIIRLWVSIADVSFFVRPRTALDNAAYERGTSVYFPNDCLPMLPPLLSNDLCSLRPQEERFTFTAELDIDREGATVDARFYRSMIRSRERLTYTAVKGVLVERDPQLVKRYQSLVPSLRLMEECFARLRTRRLQRGSIDFDLPEPQVVMDLQGEIADIVRSERHVGHMIIEEFMIAANEAVAEFLASRGVGCVYRVHAAPSEVKLADFSHLLNNLGHKVHLGRKVQPKTLAHIVELVRGQPEERLVNHALLRSMSQAVYSAENVGHYGLASTCYCHFTSPIRRYPDLIVHRQLAAALSRGGRIKDEKPQPILAGGRLQEIAEHSSRRERIAMEAEREMAKVYACLFLQGHVDDEFDGIISHVAKFGFFVELKDVFVEGLVPAASLAEDIRFEERGELLQSRRLKRSFKVGDLVRVMVEEVDVSNREIIFGLVSRTT